MKKITSSIALSLLAVAGAALSSCGGNDKPIGDVNLSFWSSFGTAYTTALDGIVAQAAQKASDGVGKSIVVDHKSQGSYDRVKKEMLSAVADGTYPNMVTGYPDHFADYLANDILFPLSELMENYNEKYDVDLLEDYYPKYMEENFALDIDDEGNKVLSGLPFNKSTELMGYNGVFVDYCASLPEYKEFKLDEIPETWQEWAIKGPKYREILNTFCGDGVNDGLCLYGKQDYEGTASDFIVAKESGDTLDGRKLLLDFSKVDAKSTRVISWDSTDNMFITLIKQWGAEYTRLLDSEKVKEPGDRIGDIMFYSKDNKPKVVECLKFFNKLNKQRIFGVPKEFNTSYSSTAFENNQVMFMLCSSGGLSYNTAKWENRFRVRPLPYYSQDGVDRKYVISQGANITLTDATTDFTESFEVMVAMTTGDLQATWCLQTGYYPCSKSATNTDKYQEFLTEAVPGGKGFNKYMEETGCTEQEALEHAYSQPTRVAYREGSNINETYYMPEENNWNKFVDAAFSGSSVIRTVIKKVFEKVFVATPADAADSVYEQILKEAVEDPDIKTRRSNINIVTD